MNRVDLALSVLLVIGAARGYWRRFFRECCGLLGLLGGVAVATLFTAAAATVVHGSLGFLPPAVETGVTFVVIFVAVHGIVNLIGLLLDRLVAGSLAGRLNQIMGAALGAMKTAAVLAFVLLFLHLFPIAPDLDAPIMSSTLGRPLVSAAGSMLRLGSQLASQPGATRSV